MRTRGFENTLREREAEAGGARRRPVGFCSNALFLCLRAPVPTGPSGERPPPVGPGPPGARDGARGPRPPVRGPGGPGRLWPVCPRRRPSRGSAAKRGLSAEWGSAGAGRPAGV